MAAPSELAELTSAWRALAGMTAVEGWRTIPILQGAACVVSAGRHFPGNEEALIVNVDAPLLAGLPQGRGFLVSVLAGAEPERTCVALSRRPSGSFELFALMSADVLRALSVTDSAAHLLRVFVQRIAAWQDFMGRSADPVLRHSEELGLFGELEILTELARCGAGARAAVESWHGPLGGLHDFSFVGGDWEVKTSAGDDWAVNVDSLAQLEPRETRPLLLWAVRVVHGDAGRTLPEQVALARDAVALDRDAATTLDERLVRAGYLSEMADRYFRRFACAERRLFVVDDSFPALTHSTVPIAVVRAAYAVDLRAVRTSAITFAEALRLVGVS